jgi:hypothetical protein
MEAHFQIAGSPVRERTLAPNAAPLVPVTLQEAVAMVEGPQTKVIAAQLDQKNSRFGYSVKLVEDGKLRSAWVDAG